MESPQKGPNGEEGPPVTTNTVFSQQRIVAWRPLFTPFCTTFILFLLGGILIIIGVLLYVYLAHLPFYDIRYDNICGNDNECGITFTINEEIKGNIYMHYKLTNFHQNHRRYIFSKSDNQLRGEYVKYESMTECGDFRSVNESKEPADLLLPSGAVALSLFNDTFAWKNTSIANFSEAGISWRSDRDKLFKRLSSNYTEGIKWLIEDNETFPNDQRNEHFIVWMRAAALPVFYKVYSRCINCYLPAGEYSIAIQNNYPVSLFNGEKHIVISKVTNFGGKNSFIGLTYIIVGAVILLFGFIVLISQIFFPRELGDTSILKKL